MKDQLEAVGDQAQTLSAKLKDFEDLGAESLTRMAETSKVQDVESVVVVLYQEMLQLDELIIRFKAQVVDIHDAEVLL